MAMSTGVSIHFAPNDKPRANSSWHMHHPGKAYIHLDIGFDDVCFHASREQLGDLYAAIGQCLTDLDAVAAGRSAKETANVEE